MKNTPVNEPKRTLLRFTRNASRFTFFLLAACGTIPPQKPVSNNCPTATAEAYVLAAQKAADHSMNAVVPQQKIHFAKLGRDWAERCVAAFPKEVGCYYYRAVNTGLYYEASPLGYQKGLRRMEADAQKVVQLDSSYDGGGGYRILGYLFLKTPAFSLKKKALVKDVAKAHAYAEEALKIRPQDADNRWLMTEVLVEEGNEAQALSFLKPLLEDYPKKRPYTEYDKTNFRKMQRLLLRLEKRLTNTDT